MGSSVPSSCTNRSVWADGFVGVWHLGKATGAPFDSTTNALTAVINTNFGYCLSTGGKIGKGYIFGGGYLSTTAATLPAGSSPRTMSAWFKKISSTAVAPGKEIAGYGDNSVNGDRFSFWIGGNGTANALGVEIGGSAMTFPWSWDNQWHHLAAVLPAGQNDLSGVNLFYDGASNAAAAGSGAINTLQTELCFGGIPNYHNPDTNYDLDGLH